MVVTINTVGVSVLLVYALVSLCTLPLPHIPKLPRPHSNAPSSTQVCSLLLPSQHHSSSIDGTYQHMGVCCCEIEL